MPRLPCFFRYVFGSLSRRHYRIANNINTALGIVFIWESSNANFTTADVSIPYYSVSTSLSVLLTFMIATRLVKYNKNVRNATGAPGRGGGVYGTAVTVFVESCALYAVNYILFLGTWAAFTSAANIFYPLLAEIQVCVTFIFPLPAVDVAA